MQATMVGKVLILLGALLSYNQVVSADVFSAELTVEGNITLDTPTVLSIFNNTNINIVVDGAPHELFIHGIELVVECLILGDHSTCDCGPGYVWSNEVCYNTTTCCTEVTCTEVISHHASLCIPKVKVMVVGTVELSAGTWDLATEQKLLTGLKMLNGFEVLNITTLQSDLIADFEANVSVAFLTTKLQEILEILELDLAATVNMETIGLVEMTAPAALVCYQSVPLLSCAFTEVLPDSMWTMSRGAEFSELANGSVARITQHCGASDRPACLQLSLNGVTGKWAGIFKCEFTDGAVKHVAALGLSVALLPDTVELLLDPLTVDCSASTAGSSPVKVTAIIAKSPENYIVTWSYRDQVQGNLQPVALSTESHYIISTTLSCAPTPEPHYINITFRNQKCQEKSVRIDIPVVYFGAPFCEEELYELMMWPKTPGGDTVFNRTCTGDREGYTSRTCIGTVWGDTYHQCVSAELSRAMDVAESFKQGFDATQSMAETIFDTLNNGSSKTTGSKEDMADLSAGISILNTMAQASLNVILNDDVLPSLIGAASNMLNQSWDSVNISIQNSMSANYLESIEGLVQNIEANNSKGVDQENVQLSICNTQTDGDCSQVVFGVAVNLNNSQGLIKTMGVKNLAEKLENKNKQGKTASLVVSSTLQNGSGDPIDIQMEFPKEHPEYGLVTCVFWNITDHEWSDTGCKLLPSDDGNQTICSCNHLTPFSALMSKTTLILPFLDEITYLGLGVSICALILFLIIEALVWTAIVKSNLSHFRHTSLVNIAISLLMADLCFLASAFPDKISSTMCMMFTVLKHFFFLTMFCWMLCLSVMLVHQLIFVFNPLRKRVFMFLSCIVGYIVPLLIVGCSYVYYKYTGGHYLKKETCWLTYDGLLRGSIHAFLLPVGIVILTNLFSMGVVIVTLTKSSATDDSKTDKDTAKSILKVILFLTPAFGVTWILGFIQLLIGEKSEEASVDGSSAPAFEIFIHYAFTILNTFQGLFLFLTGVLAEQKVREEVLKLIMTKTSSGEKDTTTTKN